ncbi:MAG: type III pantothenate kinase [Balneolaceae bacterium]|nr:type III pantothenate kinase [Balneolaceae bacterium]
MPTIALLDIGHTRVKLATASTLSPFDVERVHEWETKDVDWATIASWTQKVVVADELRCCCVVQAWLDGANDQALEEMFGMPVQVLSVGEWTEYDPYQLGVDRYLLARGAVSYYPESAVVVSAGTTITVDVVGIADEDVGGEDIADEDTGDESSDVHISHLGGWILPGARVVEKGYKSITPHFPSMSLPGIHNRITIPSTTADATQQGLALMITSMLSRIIDEFGIEVVYFTGGDGALLRDLWEAQATDPYDIHVELIPDLLFYGMISD